MSARKFLDVLLTRLVLAREVQSPNPAENPLQCLNRVILLGIAEGGSVLARLADNA